MAVAVNVMLHYRAPVMTIWLTNIVSTSGVARLWGAPVNSNLGAPQLLRPSPKCWEQGGALGGPAVGERCKLPGGDPSRLEFWCFLQRGSIACYAEPCISHRILSDRLTGGAENAGHEIDGHENDGHNGAEYHPYSEVTNKRLRLNM